jgi:hypothetical protein
MRDIRTVRRELQENGETTVESEGGRREDVLGGADSVARPLGGEEVLDGVNQCQSSRFNLMVT